MAHFGWGWGSPILGQLLPAYIHCGKWLWVHLCAGKEQLVSGGKAAQDVITPVPETALLAHFSVSARLPELLPPRHPLSSPVLSSTASGTSPQVHCPCLLGAGECGEA